MNIEKIKLQIKSVFEEVVEQAKLKEGSILVIGCSTSEISGSPMGTDSNLQLAKDVYSAFYSYLKEKGIYMAVQCCEHLNRALVIEKELADKLMLEIVNVVPQPKAGGSSATSAYELFDNPVVVEHIKGDAGVDIGGVLIGMHLKETAVPLKMKNKAIGSAIVIAARTRPRFIGGCRAVYDQNFL
jgi:uncharacterized protein (TIGR01440 family)